MVKTMQNDNEGTKEMGQICDEPFAGNHHRLVHQGTPKGIAGLYPSPGYLASTPKSTN